MSLLFDLCLLSASAGGPLAGGRTIFAEGIATGDATFETMVPSWEDWNARHLPGHRFVAELHGEIHGWREVVLPELRL